MGEHYAKQQSLLHLIERSLDNFKKIGKNNYTPAKIRSRMNSLKDIWNQCLQGNAALLQTVAPEKRESVEYFKFNHFDTANDVYQATMDYMQECLEEIEPCVSDKNSSSRLHDSTKVPSSFSLSHLPPIKIPPFTGKYEDWESFRDRFTSLIIENRDLSAFARMHFLASSLSGRALETIKSIPVTADNFEIAWQTLTSRYENKRRLVEVHVSTLANLPTVTRESASEINNLREQANQAIASLRNLNRTFDEILNDILVFSVTQKLDFATRKAWKLKGGEESRIPTYADLDRFLASRARALEELTPTNSIRPVRIPRASSSSATAVSSTLCMLCEAAHFVNKCPLFVKKSPSQRCDLIKQSNRCFNCLSLKHTAQTCPSKYSCRTCGKRHHSMLHTDSGSFSSNVASTNDTPRTESNPSASATVLSSIRAITARSRVILATARVSVGGSSGRSLVVRALLDQGSELTFISERLTRLLKLRRFRMPISISAVGGVNAGTAQYATQINISPNDQAQPVLSVTASILQSLSHYVPSHKFTDLKWEHLANLKLADPNHENTDPIDLILGADVYGEVILDGIRKGSRGQPFAQNSIFGWLISGPTSVEAGSRVVTVQHGATLSSLEQELRRFWETEEVPRLNLLSPEEQKCEEHFLETHTRSATGQYIVRLPFKQGPPIDIGYSRESARHCLRGVHRRLKSQPALKSEYASFLREYENLGHMRTVIPNDSRSRQVVYLPHHPVIRDSSSTTRLRVVFNASSGTTNSTSLNDHLLSSPKLQTDLAAVILRWRQYRYVFSADIAKMYRQILVDPRDVDYQRIVWSEDEEAPVREYQLLTVTYGTACAPFLALRVLRQLLQDEGDAFPLAISVLTENIYVDDVLFGADDIPLIRQIRDQVCSLLQRGHFELRKWSSNSAALLSDIQVENHGLACTKTLQTDEQLKILGINWNPSRDLFQVNVSLPTPIPKTKRAILSIIAKFFDPLGWVTPATVNVKILLQQLWLLKVSWDDVIPAAVLSRWETIYTSLSSLDGISIERWIKLGSDTSHIEFHGFADASNAAYAAAVYVRVTSLSGEVTTSLLIGKSKVAPVKSLSVPRLELSAAVLLTRLMEFVRASLSLLSIPHYCWTDSTIVLAWLKQHPSRWKTFVANRVSEIQTRLPQAVWRHVPTQDNPADCASRGCLGSQLRTHQLWWRGPAWLPLDDSEWPSPTLPYNTDLEGKSLTVQHLNQTRDAWDLASRFSSWPKLLRVTAYILKFVRQLRPPHNDAKFVSPLSFRALGHAEIQNARDFWIRKIQAELFPRELIALSNRLSLSNKNSLLALNPFLDDSGIIRVGGRLVHAPLPFTSKHPVLLADHPLVRLLIQQMHVRSLHAGAQLTLATLRREFWVLKGRSLVRSAIFRCVACTRERAAPATERMGNLPSFRVTPLARAFLHCGVDYAGPILVRSLSGRGVASHKAYISLWVCMATRAIHLELVDGYSTGAFLAAYSRFCSRRGLPDSIYSDNGTNFVGADKELTIAYRSALRDPDFQNRTAGDKVKWHFIPPSAPHFGGLWEAGVRSVKHHLRRVVGSHTLTFEEFTTLLCRIEACLNSRPLAPLTDTLDDYDALTPGHFLIGDALTAIPEPTLLSLHENRLSRWQSVHQMFERFWKCWQHDYVNTLQQRTKWRQLSPDPIRTGQLVLLHNPLLPPCKWELARIIRCHAGTDGLVRVVTVRTAKAEYKRPISKICLLPIAFDKQEIVTESVKSHST